MYLPNSCFSCHNLILLGLIFFLIKLTTISKISNKIYIRKKENHDLITFGFVILNKFSKIEKLM